jgi:hypothetical protein
MLNADFTFFCTNQIYRANIFHGNADKLTFLPSSILPSIIIAAPKRECVKEVKSQKAKLSNAIVQFRFIKFYTCLPSLVSFIHIVHRICMCRSSKILHLIFFAAQATLLHVRI